MTQADRRCGNYQEHTPHDWPEAIHNPLFHCDGNHPENDDTLWEGNQPCPRVEPHPEHSWELGFCRGVYPDAVPKSVVDSPQNVAGRAEIVRWADRAMFKAEPIPEGGPKVWLLWCTPDPLGAIAAACKMYKGEVVRDLSTVTDAERLEYFEQVQKTKLKAPFEFVKFHFLIEGVTRAFTHQMVRQRTAVYAQESLRFAVVGGEDTPLPVGLPPSLSGTDGADAKIWSVEPGDDLTPAERMRL